ncbi:acyl-CoA transferase, partial [Candidatus Falkowbacteria bacterium]|nr:acyl-CoA transferase [Candidatus Falkowbacteria bacterium]
MPTTRETILTALADLLRTIPHVPVLRGEVLPERIPPAGMIILRDGTPGEPGVTLSPLTYHFQHRAELEMIVQSATDRDALFDALVA